MIIMIFVFQKKKSQTGRKTNRNEELMLPVAFDFSVGWRMLKRN